MFSSDFLEKLLNSLCFILFRSESNSKYKCIYLNDNYLNIYNGKILGNCIMYYIDDININKDYFDNLEIGKLITNSFKTIKTNDDVILITLKMPEYLSFGIFFPELCNELNDHINKTKIDFISNVSHELRTPLNGIIGMTQIIKETNLNKEQLFCINNIEKCNYDLLSLINDILDYSKLDNGSLELDIKSFSIKDCIESAININLMKIRETGINVHYKITNNVPIYILGDQKRLKQVLINLINNSLKFTTSGSINIIVSLIEDKEPDYTQLKFSIKDTGIGIPENMVHKLFKPFVQVPNSFKQGSGLGLVICKQIVKLMNGDIKIEESVINVGTTMSFTIKIKKTHENSDNKKMIDTIKNKYILIVDDNQVNRMSLMRSCRKWGLIPILCSTVNEALEQCDSFDFYCGLIDIIMPEHSGIWLARQMINDKKIKYPLIGLSSLKEMNKESEELFLHYLIKPVQEQVLYELILNIHKDNQFNLINLTKSINNQKKILIADDIHYNRKIIEKFLIKYGIDPEYISNAENGQEVIDKVTNKTFDIIFLDIKMPIKSGIEAFEYIKTNNLKKYTIYIAVTAYMNEKDNYYIEKHEFDYTLFKPINYSTLEAYMNLIK